MLSKQIFAPNKKKLQTLYLKCSKVVSCEFSHFFLIKNLRFTFASSKSATYTKKLF